MTKPNFILARQKASEILILQDVLSVPINPLKIKLKEYTVYFFSFQEWSNLNNISVEQLTLDNKYSDGYTLFIRDNNIYFVFYNKEIVSKGRINWTIAHELGHIALNHTNQCSENELEANAFASQLLLPQCLLMKLVSSGKKITIDYITKTFGLSKEAATNCIYSIGRKLDNNYQAQYDDIILELFSDFLKQQIPEYNYLNYYDEMDEKRNSWL